MAAVSICRHCGGTALTRVYTDLPDFFQGTTIVESYGRCIGCGLLQAETSRADLAPLYEGYALHQHHGPLFRAVRHRVLRAGYDVHAPEAGRTRLLDYGCGDGSHLRAMARKGWDTEGLEFDAAHAAALARELGMTVRAADDDLGDWLERFDLVTLNFTFEHLEHPRATLRRIFGLLRPGGNMYASIPHIEGAEARLFGRRWLDLDPPRHRTFFTRPQLDRLLREEGFAAPRFRTTTLPTSFAGSVLHTVSNRCHPRVMALLLPLGVAWSLVVRDSCLLVWATRP